LSFWVMKKCIINHATNDRMSDKKRSFES